MDPIETLENAYQVITTKLATRVNSPKIVLIDGDRLVQFMIENDVGVSKQDFY
jgi:restriction endonuclease Mrr